MQQTRLPSHSQAALDDCDPILLATPLNQSENQISYRLPDSFDAFSRGAGPSEFFASADWFRLLHGYGFESPPSLHVAAFPDASAYLPLTRDTAARRLISLTNQYSISFAPPFPTHYENADAVCVIASAIRNERPRWAEVDVRCLIGPSPRTAEFISGFRRAGWTVFPEHQTWNWYANVAGLSFKEYMRRRPGQLRNTLKRKGLLASREHSVEYRLIDAAGENLDEAIAHYQRVYENCWKLPERRVNFIPRLMQLCAISGTLRLGLLYLDGQPTAAQFWIVSGETAYIYKLAHDRNFDALSVGTLLSGFMSERAIDADGVARIDFGLGNEPYKRDWMDDRQQLIRVRAINPGTLRGAVLVTRLKIRDALRRLRVLKYTPLAPENRAVG